MQENNIAELMRLVCNRIEKEFVRTTAEFEKFATLRAPFLRDQYAHMEVFDVSESVKDKLQDFVDAIIINEFYPIGLSLSVLMWTPEETKQYFQKDVDYIKSSRKILDEEVLWETKDPENIFRQNEVYIESSDNSSLEGHISHKEKLPNNDLADIIFASSKAEFHAMNISQGISSYENKHGTEKYMTEIEDIKLEAA